jgi:hypothetical protein
MGHKKAPLIAQDVPEPVVAERVTAAAAVPMQQGSVAVARKPRPAAATSAC